jgi:hypothetical protein
MQRISKPKLLIGEGNEEVFFFEALLAHLGINNVNVESYGGKSKLRGYLKTFNVRPEHQTVISLVHPGINPSAVRRPGAYRSKST